jgi:hypothetical protein
MIAVKLSYIHSQRQYSGTCFVVRILTHLNYVRPQNLTDTQDKSACKQKTDFRNILEYIKSCREEGGERI